MNQKKNNFSSSDFMFEEEVNENELSENVNNYKVTVVKNRRFYVIIFIIVLLLLSLFALIFGFVYSGKDRGNVFKDGNVIVNRYSLYVVHSNEYYGANLLSFDNYRTLEDSYSYTINVTNSNKIDIDYKYILVNPLFGKDNVDMSKINYTLYNGDSIVGSGILENKEYNVLANLKISSNSINKLNLKVWSVDLDENVKFTYKINIEV